jgi:hypothetical protein
VNELFDNKADPSVRAVLEDAYREQGRPMARLGVALWVAAAADADAADAADAAADADAAAADADAAAADAAAADAAAADADAADAAADAADADAADAAADADADAADDARTRQSLYSLLTKEIDMRNGLKVIQVPGRYGYSVTLAGRLRRLTADEYELHGAVTVARTGGYRMDGLQRLASDGPKKGYDVTEPANAVEEIHRLLVRRVLRADEEAWAKACPKPATWRAEWDETP